MTLRNLSPSRVPQGESIRPTGTAILGVDDDDGEQTGKRRRVEPRVEEENPDEEMEDESDEPRVEGETFRERMRRFDIDEGSNVWRVLKEEFDEIVARERESVRKTTAMKKVRMLMSRKRVKVK